MLSARDRSMTMTSPAYPAARLVAPKVRAHFVTHADDATRRGRTDTPQPPDAETIEALIDAAFWASLRREESYVPKISLAFASPEAAPHPLRFERPLPLSPAALVKVAPAVERAGVHLGVHREGGELMVWGTIRAIPMSIVVEVAAPGLLVVKHHRGGEAGKFVNVAVLEGDQVKVVDEDASSLPDCPPLLSSLLGFDSPASWLAAPDSVNILVQLAVSMRTHGRGGLLLIVPTGVDSWQDSIVRPIPYAVVPAFGELAELSREPAEVRRTRGWQELMQRVVEAVAGLTAVDGATVLTKAYDLLAFGAKIARRKGSPQVEQVTVTEPIEGDVPQILHPTQLGGTRHLSAAQFVHDQRDAVALVASQDGRFTVFAWSPCEEMVHAHRVEALLL
jgi:sensor domain DACNV-containing protein